MRLRVSVLALLGVACLIGQELSAWELYEEGRAMEKKGKMAEAYILYSEAVAKDPKNKTYWQRSQAVKTRAALQAKPQPRIPDPGELDAEFANASEAPEPLEQATPVELRDAKKPLPPMELDALEGTKDINLDGDSKKLFEDLAHLWGLDCVFDSDYEPTKPFRFKLEQATYADSIHALETATGAFIVPISKKLFLVLRDTPQKRNQSEPTVTVSVLIPEAVTQQDFQETIRAVQQAMALEKVSWDSTSSTVVLRDKISKVMPALALFEQLSRPRAQVSLEMRFLQVSRNDAITYGLNLPSMFSLTPLASVFNSKPSIPSGIAGLLKFGGGYTAFGIGITNAAMVAQMSKSSGQLLLQSDLRSDSGQKATFHVGDRYPILTAGYSGPVTGGQYFTPAPSFNYEDLGLTLTVTPLVHTSDEVSLDMEAQFKVLTGQSINGIPVISNKSVKQALRIKFGEFTVISGLLTTNEARMITGLAGFNRIPILRDVTATHTNNDDRQEVLILVRPTLLTIPPGEGPDRTFRTGSDTRPVTPLR